MDQAAKAGQKRLGNVKMGASSASGKNAVSPLSWVRNDASISQICVTCAKEAKRDSHKVNK